MLYMFRDILVHHQEQLYRLYLVYTKCDVQLIKFAPEDELI